MANNTISSINDIFKELYCTPRIHFAVHTKLFDVFYDKEAELKKKSPLEYMMSDWITTGRGVFDLSKTKKKV